MATPRVFCNTAGQSFPVYLQQDVSAAWVDPIRALITVWTTFSHCLMAHNPLTFSILQNFGGLGMPCDVL